MAAQRDWILCSKCRANISVVETDGDVQEIVIRIRAARKDAAFPLTANRQALIGEMRALVDPALSQRRSTHIRHITHTRSSKLLNETLKQYRIHKGDKHLAAHALGITVDRLIERLGHYRRRGWARRNGNGSWVRVVRP
jgi:hypothetical protein